MITRPRPDRSVRASRRPRPPRPPVGEDGRRLTTANRAILVALVAVLLGLLFDAPGLHKTAFNQPPGWKRTVALDLTKPLADVSHAIYLDRPRAWIKSALGRSGDDRIDTAIVLPAPPRAKPSKPAAHPEPQHHATRPTATTPSKPVHTAPARHATPKRKPVVPAKPVATPKPKPVVPAKPVFAPAHPLKAWIGGDSLVITAGYALLRAIESNPAIKTDGGVDGQISTGLARPDVFNWFTEIRHRLDTLHPGLVVLCFGANDDTSYMTGLPPGVTIRAYGDAAWRREYGRRVGGLIDLINQAGAYVVWLGLPVTRDPGQTQRFDRINAVVRKQVRLRRRHAAFIDIHAVLAGPGRGYAQYLTNRSGDSIDVRAPDGVHYSSAGGDLIAAQILKQLNQALDLTSWRTAKAGHRSGSSGKSAAARSANRE